MATAVMMPKQGQSVETCVVNEWFKKKGDKVAKGEALLSYETDKASFELESPADGVLLEVFFKEQDDVPVMVNVAVIGEPGESTDQYKPSGDPQTVAPQAESSATAAKPQAPAAAPAPAVSPAVKTENDMLRVSPRARKTAEERGVDVAGLAGSGPKGRVIEQDVLAAQALTPAAAARRSATGLSAPMSGSGIGGRVRAADLGAATAAAAAAQDTITEVKLPNIRKIIGSRMIQSLQQAAQLTMNAYADATALLEYRKKVKALGKDLGLPDITVTDLVAFAVARTLPLHPELNAVYKDQKIYRYGHVHLAMAVDTPRGLMVPVIRFADLLALGDLSASIKSLAGQCKEGTINPDLLSGGTITITNLGMFGIESFTPILNPPQVAILGVNAIAPRPRQLENGD